MGNCICGYIQNDEENVSATIAISLSLSPSNSNILFQDFFSSNDNVELDDKTFHYLSNSLFDVMDETSADNDNIEETRERNEMNKIFDENYGMQRFGALFIHYLSNCLDDEGYYILT